MLVRIPQMDAGLVAHLDLDAKVRGGGVAAADHRVLGLPRQIGAVAI